MNCKECLPLIPGYLDDELSEVQAAPLRRHLMDCRACRKALSSEKSLKRWFAFEDALEVEVPAGFAQRVARRAFAGDTGTFSGSEFASGGLGEPSPGGGRLVAFAGQGGATAEDRLQNFVLRATAAAAVLLLVLSAWMRNVQLPDGGRISATDPGESVQMLLERADALNAAEAQTPSAAAAKQGASEGIVPQNTPVGDPTPEDEAP